MKGFDPRKGPQFPGSKPDESESRDDALQTGVLAGMLGGSLEDAVVAQYAVRESKARRLLLRRWLGREAKAPTSD